MNYKVIYEIEIEANTPIEAALEVEQIMKNPVYRPAFTIIDDKTKSVFIDLNDEPVEE